MKSKHSKVKDLEHLRLLPNQSSVRNEEAELIFQLRCRTTRIRMNMKEMYDTYECRACDDKNETANTCYTMQNTSRYEQRRCRMNSI